MSVKSIDWKSGIGLGAVAGVIWGFMAMVVNAASGTFSFESGLVHNLAAFTIGGGVFGIVVGGFLVLTRGVLPFKGMTAKAVVVSTSVWLVLRIGGAVLSGLEPDRYTVVLAETMQGLVLAAIMGFILGLLCRMRKVPEVN